MSLYYNSVFISHNSEFVYCHSDHSDILTELRDINSEFNEIKSMGQICGLRQCKPSFCIKIVLSGFTKDTQ